MRNIKIIFISIIWLSTLPSHAQLREAAFKMNERLGRGINMGNCFEAPAETDWGNPWKPEYFRIMSNLGIKHVRIPIRWEPAARSSLAAPYTINPAFLARIKQVVDTALKYKLHAIINMHHHDSLIANPDKQKARFLSQWSQIAQYFKNYPDSLLFEVLNEPNGNLTAAKWNTFFSEALTEIRKSNPTRCVILGLAEWGGLSGLNILQIPPDENLILTIHYYNPFKFTHQGAEWTGTESQSWLGTKWNDTEAERQTVENEFRYAMQFSQDQHIPIHIGEFGAYSKADLASRVRWTTFLSRWFEQQKFSWAYWEFSAGFGIYNPATKQLLTPLVDALLHNPMPSPVPTEAILLYKSNFTSGTDGWSVNFNQGAAGSWNRTGGKMNISVTNGGTESWYVQATHGGISLEKGKTYRITFTVKAASNRTASVYAGKSSDPWTAYSDYSNFQITTADATLSYTFTMNSASDSNARLAFDLGKSTTGLTIYDIKIEEIRIVTSSFSPVQNSLKWYPNPVGHELIVDNVLTRSPGMIYDLSGKMRLSQMLLPGQNSIKTGSLPAGIYLVRIGEGRNTKNFSIIKQ
jgi:aryl-phospho-beta-D-glucosidase BglC (GH1 family)